MIRIVTLLISIVILFAAVTAEGTKDATSSTTTGTSNLTNDTNASQQSAALSVSDNLSGIPGLKSKTSTTTQSSNQAGAQVTSTATPKPVYKESVGSVYEADYTEPQPMTFTSYPTC